MKKKKMTTQELRERLLDELTTRARIKHDDPDTGCETWQQAWEAARSDVIDDIQQVRREDLGRNPDHAGWCHSVIAGLYFDGAGMTDAERIVRDELEKPVEAA